MKKITTAILSALALVSCALPEGSSPALTRAELAASEGDLAAAFCWLEQEIEPPSSFTTEVLTSDPLRPLSDDPVWRPRLRALIQKSARGSHVAMVRPSEPGEPLHALITIVDRRSRAPVAGARVDVVHTDANGYYWYPGEAGDFNPRLFGTAITDEAGRVRVDTIRPRRYAAEFDAGEPAHIHFTVFVRGELRRASEFFLDDDPRVTAEFIEAMRNDPLPVAHVTQSEDGEWQVEVTIPIGRRGPPRSSTAEGSTAQVWDLTSHLTAAQRATNAQIYALLPFDEDVAENEFDSLAYDLAQQDTEEARLALRALEHGGGRKRQSAAARAYLFIAQRSLATGNLERATEHALHLYLSGAPHRLRLEALRVYCSSASPALSIRWLELIETGAQDAPFAPLLPELKAARRVALGQK